MLMRISTLILMILIRISAFSVSRLRHLSTFPLDSKIIKEKGLMMETENPTTWAQAKYCDNDKNEGVENFIPEILSKTIPNLSSHSHKGSSGRIGILGGSARYTGAPYYAGLASLRAGADLSFIFCASEASTPIKCYSPELMVAGVYSATEFDRLVGQLGSKVIKGKSEKLEVEALYAKKERFINEMVAQVTSLMDRMHALVIGPGLGRCPLVMEATAEIIREGRRRGLSMVLDADALYLLSLEEYQDILVTDCPNEPNYNSTIVLTPNSVEYNRLVKTIGRGSAENFEKKLSGIVLVKKGHQDVIQSLSSGFKMECKEIGGLKRSGGLGDILSGIIGTFLAWNSIKYKTGTNSQRQENVVLGSWMACCITKQATKKAFENKKRSMTAPDVLDDVGSIVTMMTESTIES